VSAMSPFDPNPSVKEVLRFEDLPLGSLASRRAVVRWATGPRGRRSVGTPTRVLVCKGDHGKSRLMSSRAGMQGVAGSVSRGGAHNLGSAQLRGCLVSRDAGLWTPNRAGLTGTLTVHSGASRRPARTLDRGFSVQWLR
jgi:hypothetical protein